MIDLDEFPWQIIEKVEFKDGGVVVTFHSGNALMATHHKKEVIDVFRQDCIERLGKDKVIG